MINKRLLIKHLLAHNDENSFYDKKRKIDISHKEGKAKFLKHICALSNSNPKNNSYIVIGVDDEDNNIVGVDFFDDSKIQNLINAYLTNPPIVQYENIPFPHLPDDKVVGLVTIRSIEKITSLRKNIWKYYGGSVFFRDGSMSMPKVFDIEIKDVNSKIVEAIENNAQNNIEHTLNGVFDFLNKKKDYNPQYKVFKEYFVVCWAGQKKIVKNEVFYCAWYFFNRTIIGIKLRQSHPENRIFNTNRCKCTRYCSVVGYHVYTKCKRWPKELHCVNRCISKYDYLLLCLNGTYNF